MNVFGGASRGIKEEGPRGPQGFLLRGFKTTLPHSLTEDLGRVASGRHFNPWILRDPWGGIKQIRQGVFISAASKEFREQNLKNNKLYMGIENLFVIDYWKSNAGAQLGGEGGEGIHPLPSKSLYAPQVP